MDLQELRGRLAEIEAERAQIHEAAGDAALTDDQQTRWDELDTAEAETRASIEEAERRERVAASRARWSTAHVGTRVSPWDEPDVMRMESRAAVDRARAALDSRDSAAEHLADEQRARLERMLQTRNDNLDGSWLARRLLVTEHPDYREAFMRLVTRSQPVLSPEQSAAIQRFEEFRAMNIGTGSAGGWGIPVLIDPTIILTAQGHPNPFFQLARVETITTDQWKGVSSAGVTWQFRAEGATVSDNSPTLAQPTVPAHRADGYIPYTLEVDMDYPGFASEMSRLLAEGYSELLVSKFTTGTGSDEPTGIVTALDANAAVEVATATAGTLAAGDVNKVWRDLPIRYRNARCAWMSSTDINNIIQQLGASNNNSAFTVDFTAEGVAVLKGRQMHLNDYMATMPSGTSAGNLLIVGDWSNYLIAQRAGMSIELVPHVFDTSGSVSLPNGSRAWFAWARVGADSINDNGFRLLQNKTS